MSSNPRAGQPADPAELVDIDGLIAAYYQTRPDPSVASQRVAFGTSGHRGSALHAAFNEDHILAVVEATCRYRDAGRDRRPAVSGPRHPRAVAAGVPDRARSAGRARGRRAHRRRRRLHADAGHLARHPDLESRPPRAPGRRDRHHPVAQSARGRRHQVQPAQRRPGRHRRHRLDRGRGQRAARSRPRRRPARAVRAGAPSAQRSTATTTVDATSTTWPTIVDLDARARGGLKLGRRSARRRQRRLLAGDRRALPARSDGGQSDASIRTFGFMTVDWDGKIRMDPSSPYAMASLVKLRDGFDLALGNDADADRHGIVTRGGGPAESEPLPGGGDRLPVPAPARAGRPAPAIGKTLVSSSLIDRVADGPRPTAGRGAGRLQVVRARAARRLARRSAARRALARRSCGATAAPWSTDKDGILLCLLAAELTATLGQDPGELYRELTQRLGEPVYRRVDARATPRPEGAAQAAVARRRAHRRSWPASRS